MGSLGKLTLVLGLSSRNPEAFAGGFVVVESWVLWGDTTSPFDSTKRSMLLIRWQIAVGRGFRSRYISSEELTT